MKSEEDFGRKMEEARSSFSSEGLFSLEPQLNNDIKASCQAKLNKHEPVLV